MTRSLDETDVDGAFGQHRALMQHGDLAVQARARKPCRARPRPPNDPLRCPSSRAVSSVSLSVMPATGSSTSSSLGSWASSMPISSHCFWPWERSAGKAVAMIAEPYPGQDDVDALARDPIARPEQGRDGRRAGPSGPDGCCPRPCGSRRPSASGTCGQCRDSAISASSSLVRSTLPVETDVAFIGPRLAGDDIHHGGLAGPVGADDGAHLARLENEREIVDGAETVERDADTVEIEHGFGEGRTWSSPTPPVVAWRRRWRWARSGGAGTMCRAFRRCPWAGTASRG